MIELREKHMMKRARGRWSSLSEDDRAVLSYAYRDIFQHPQLVGYYKLEFVRMKSSKKYMQIHTLRVGDANFTLIDVEEGVFIYDLWLNSDLALAAE